MWLGIIIGLLLGAAFDSFAAAMLLAAIGGVVGVIVARRRALAGDASQPVELQHDVLELQLQMQQAMQRIGQLEKCLQQLATAEPAVEPQASTAFVEPTAAAADEELPELLLPDEDELSRQALTATAADAVPASAIETLEPGPSPVQPPEVAAHAETAGARVAASHPAAETFAYRSVELEMPATPSWLSEFVARWITGGNPIVKVGVLILFLGLAFLLRYVAENTVVPIELRYAGVAAGAVGLLLFGWRWRERPDNYGLILQGAGIGVLYLTTLAGMKLHPLIPAGLGFAILIAVAACAALLAILQDALALAVVAALGGFAAPVLASTGSQNHLALFGYLTVLNLGIVAIAWFKAWRLLNLVGFGCTLFLATAWGDKYYQPALFKLAEPFLLLFFVLYVLIAFFFARRTLADADLPAGDSFADHVRQAAPQVSYVDASLVFGVPLATFGLQYLLVRSFENGPAYSALGCGLLYIFLATALFRQSGRRYALLSETMLALAVIFGSLAIPLGLDGEWTSAAWAVEAAGVYWVGVRQQRVHARLFALLLMFGSAVFFALELRPGGEASVIDGSWLGGLMLAAAFWWVYRLLRLAPAGGLHAFEPRLCPWLIAGGCFFVALLPFLWWRLNWASTALALLGTLAVFAARRLAERTLLAWGGAGQLVAGALYLTTLHRADSGVALADGWHGLVAVGLIGLALLAAAWSSLRQSDSAAGEAEAGDEENPLLVPVLLGGLLFINLAPLFVLPWRLAALVWPLTGIATLWWAIRRRQPAALAFALGLQLVAGAIALGSRLAWFDAVPGLAEARPFLHSGFWSPLLIGLAAFVAARLLQRRDDEPSALALGWAALVWGAGWWGFAWAAECDRVLVAATAVPALLAVTLLTAGLWRTLALRLAWRQLGQATLAYLPLLALLLGAQAASGSEHPLAGWGALVWPLALAMHVRLLRDQPAWLGALLQQAAHIAGVWLFLVVAGHEVHWHLAGWGGPDSAWAMLGWLLAPLAYLWALSSERLGERWPLAEFRAAYAVAAALPVAAFLLGWTWLSTLLGDGAAPLPYLPLLNPLEIGQFAVLLGIALWWRGLTEHSVFRASGPLLLAVLGLTAFAVISSLVLRTCHQWGGVPWQASALLDSMLAQSALSIIWSVIAIGLMLFANRNGLRWIWIVGAALVAVVVGKLFLVELAASGSLERIVSFIVVGLLLLLVGYFAPLPPRPTVSEAP
ncbi:DUF2339 domain-containing protein [Dechloromonas sp. A34]|uniref:DUF2339 domain-containing protein n=1 Tax=Dechloromonas sp. A34 TaxID=447588 RepID=UPI002248F2AA|nr:DUF2339 domain-containing protein [Dechloromonas sp. A34]